MATYYKIDLPSSPNASFSTTIGDNNYNIEFRTIGDRVLLYIDNGSDYLINGRPLVLNFPLNLSTQYLDSGVFMIIGTAEPIYDNFSELSFVYASL